MMNFQFGSDKCVRIHFGKTHNTNICVDLEVDAWKEELVIKRDGRNKLEDKFVGSEGYGKCD